MSFADLAASVGRRDDATDVADVADIIEFVESDWGLKLRLYPVQRVILKAHYGLALDDNPNGYPLDRPVPKNHPKCNAEQIDDEGFYRYRIIVTDWRRENPRYHTEASYLKFLHSEGRCNIDKVVPGVERRELVLSVGRRSGKTLITSCIVAYETYKLLQRYNAQKHYGVSQSNVIQLISVATGKDQAGLLFNEAKGHFTVCDFFKPFTANNTQSFYTFQSPYNIDRHGSYKDNPKAPYSFKVTFMSSVAKGLRGGNNIFVGMDEAAHFGEEGQASADEVYQAVEPSTRTFSPKDPKDKSKVLKDKKGNPLPNEGRIVMISSPLGKQGLFYKQFRLGFGDNLAADNLLCIQAPTWEVNPTVPANTFVGSYLKDPTVFFTEFGAEFTDRTTGWLQSWVDLEACIDKSLRPKKRAAPRAPHFLGLDVALVGDHSALAVGHNETDGLVGLDLIERIRAGEGDFKSYDRLEFEDVADWVADVSKRFYIADGVMDQWAGIPMEQALIKRGLRQVKSIQFTQTLHSQVFQNFKNMMFDRKLALYDYPIPADEDHCDYLRELMELQAEVLSKYIIKVGKADVDGRSDDYSDALVRMVWCATQNSSKKIAMVGARNHSRMGEGMEAKALFGKLGKRGGLGGYGSEPSRQPFGGLRGPGFGRGGRGGGRGGFGGLGGLGGIRRG